MLIDMDFNNGENISLTEVPTLTSNYSPSGGIAFSRNSGETTWKAFDNDDTTYVVCKEYNHSAENYIGYNFNIPICIKTVTMKPMLNHTAKAVTVKIQAFDNEVTQDWVDLYSQSSWTATNNVTSTFSLTNTKKYNTYRIWFSDGLATYSSGTYTYIKSLQFSTTTQ